MQTIAEAIVRVGRLLGELFNPTRQPAPVFVPVRVRPAVRRRR